MPDNTPSIPARFPSLSLGTRFFLEARWAWTPYREMAALFPPKGRILDGGCGHGLLSLTLAAGSPRRKVLGLDHSGERICLARQAARGLENLAFREGDFTSPPPGPYDGIALIDVLHYLSYPGQADLLKKVFKLLRKGGVLVFREVDPDAGLPSLLNRAHETLMTSFGFTKAQNLHFRKRSGWMDLAKDAGFQVSSRPMTRFPFADVLFLGKKP